jgi:hypothetical protein
LGAAVLVFLATVAELGLRVAALQTLCRERSTLLGQ